MSEPSRGRVEAYEKALGCRRFAYNGRCDTHHRHPEPSHLGCPVAVAAARVEAERVAEVEAAERGRARDLAAHLEDELAQADVMGALRRLADEYCQDPTCDHRKALR